jgi:hypothetical protein
LKAAATDSLKKCATFLGVGLHLYADKPLNGSAPRASHAGNGRPPGAERPVAAAMLHREFDPRTQVLAVEEPFRLAAEVLKAIEAGIFHPIVGWQCKECPFRSQCWAWR